MADAVDLGTIFAGVELRLTTFERGSKTVFDTFARLEEGAKQLQAMLSKLTFNPDLMAAGVDVAGRSLEALDEQIGKTKAALKDLSAQTLGTQMGTDAKTNAEGIRAQASAIRQLTRDLGKLGEVKTDLSNAVRGTDVAIGKLTAFGDEAEAQRLKASAAIVQKISVVKDVTTTYTGTGGRRATGDVAASEGASAAYLYGSGRLSGDAYHAYLTEQLSKTSGLTGGGLALMRERDGVEADMEAARLASAQASLGAAAEEAARVEQIIKLRARSWTLEAQSRKLQAGLNADDATSAAKFASSMSGLANDQKAASHERAKKLGEFGANAASAVTLGVGAAVYDAANFDYQTQLLANNAQGMTPAGLKQLRTLSLSLGAQTGQSPLDIAGGGKQIQDFGFSSGETRTILPQAVNLATAQGGSVTDAGQSLGAFMREFGIAADKAHDTANLTYKAVQFGNINLEQYEQAFKRAGAVTANLGVKPEEGLALFGTLTQHGFTGPQAATQIRGLVEQAVKAKTPEQSRAMAVMDKIAGTTLTRDFSAEGLARLQPSGLIKEFEKATGGRPDLIARLLPNTSRGGYEAVVNVLGKGKGDYQQKLRDLNGGGNQVDQGAAAVENTTVGQLKVISGQFQQSIIPLGQQLAKTFTEAEPSIKAIAKDLTDLLTAFNGLPGPVKSVVVGIGGLNLLFKGLEFIGITSGLANLVKAFKFGQIAIKLFGVTFPEVGAAIVGAGEAIAAFVGGLTAGAIAITAAIAVAVAAVVGFGVAYATNFHHTRDVTNSIVKEIGQILHYVPAAFKEEFGLAVKAVEQFAAQAWSAGKGFVEAIGKGVKDAGAGLVAGVKSVFSEVANLLPHSDAKDGPFSSLTASGRAIPGTLAEGVKQNTGVLTSAVKEMAAKSKFDEIASALGGSKSKKPKKTEAEIQSEKTHRATERAEDATYALTHTKAETERYTARRDYGKNRDLGVSASVAGGEYAAQMKKADKDEESEWARHILKLEEIARRAQSVKDRLVNFTDDLTKRLAGKRPTDHDDAVTAANAQADEDTRRAYDLIGGSGPLPKSLTDLIAANQTKSVAVSDSMNAAKEQREVNYWKRHAVGASDDTGDKLDALDDEHDRMQEEFAGKKDVLDAYESYYTAERKRILDAQKKADDEAQKEDERAAKDRVKALDEDRKTQYEAHQITLFQYRDYLKQRMALIEIEVFTVHAATQEQMADLATLQNALNETYGGGRGRHRGKDDGQSGAGEFQGASLKDTIGDSLGQSVQKGIEHFHSLRDFWKSTLKSMIDDVKSWVSQVAAQWAKSQFLGTAKGGGNPFSNLGGLAGFGNSSGGGTPPIAGDAGGGSSPPSGLMSLAQKFLMHGNNALQAGGIAAAGYGLYNAFHKKGKHGLLAKLGLLAGAAGGFALGGPMGAEYGAGLGSWAGGQFAAGGKPPVGKLSLVGEKGPELFVPSVPGTILPASQTSSLFHGGMTGGGKSSITMNHYGDVNNVPDVQGMHQGFMDDLQALQTARPLVGVNV